MLKQLPKFALILLAGAFVLSSCKDDPASFSNDEPPQLPSAETMEMDMSTFESAPKESIKAKQTKENFSQAVGRAFVLKSIIGLNLAIPKALLRAANNAEPEFNEDGQWVWSYSKQTGGEEYGVRLVATRESENEITWEFYVTNSTLEIEDRLFFTGVSNDDGTEGTWSYYQLMGEEEGPVSNIQWSVAGETDVRLRLDVVSDRFGNEGDYIEYSFQDNIKHMVYYNADADQTTELQWNVESNVGFIIAPDYNNGEKACWDENFDDVACS